MKFKAIIFDMDGTIIDTSHIWAQATKDLITSKGIPYTPELEQELHKRSHGLAMDKTCKLIKDITNMPDSVEHLMREKSRIACSLYRQGIRFIEGFEQFHVQVLAHSLKTGIATNADEGTLLITKQVLGIERFFGKHIYSIACVNNVCKPDPAIYLHAAQQLEVNPSNCLAIEDSAHGIKAAQRAGMFCIGINTSRNYEQVKEADLIIDSYNELSLPDILNKNI